MAVDPYQPCPCGSGKKIKFCCHDLIGELDKVYRMIEGDQPRAALRHVEQTLVKYPDRSSLLDLQASLQLALGLKDEARDTVQRFLASDPNNAVAHTFDAIIQAEAENTQAAIEAFQNALEMCGDIAPQRISDAILLIARLLFNDGNPFAARNLLWLLDDLNSDDDKHAQETIKHLDERLPPPPILRDRYVLRGLPSDHPAATEMSRITSLAYNGRWRAAAELCDEILPDHLDEPLFIYNRALLSGYLGDLKNCVAGLRLYARQAIPLGDAVEAEALALMLDPATFSYDMRTNVELQIADEQEFISRLANHPNVVQGSVPPPDPEDEGPRPQRHYILLDRPLPEEEVPLTVDILPRYQLTLLQYPRQTDRPERVIIVGVLESKLPALMETLKSVLGESLGEELERSTHSDSSVVDSDPADNIYFPDHVDSKDYQRLIKEVRRQSYMDWLDQPHPLLEGKTPREAVQIEELRLPAMACLLLLTQRISSDWLAEELADVRRELELPELEMIDPTKVIIDTLPLISLSRLDLSAVSTDQLFHYHQRALLARNRKVLRRVDTELLTRDDVPQEVTHSLHMAMVFSELDYDAAIDRIEQLKREAQEEGTSNANWDLLELRLSFHYGRSDRVTELMEHLQQEHADEPHVMQALQQFLMQILSYGSRFQDLEPHQEQFAHAEESSGQIWTPDGSSLEGSGSSKIWTPD